MLSIALWIIAQFVQRMLGMPKGPNKKLKTLGWKVQKLRKAKGLTQEELVEDLGISRVYMGYIEQVRETPSLKLLLKISKKLGVKIEELFQR